MAEQPPVSAAPRPPLIAKKPPVPWWKQRSKRQPRKVLVNRPRNRGKAAGKNPPPQAQSTDRATQDTFSNSASNMPATKKTKTNAFKKGRRKKKKKKNPTLLVLDSWENDGANGPLDAPAVDEEEVVLDSWENESVTQQPSTGAFDDGGSHGHENSRGHVTNDSSAATVNSQPNISNNTGRVYGQVDQGLSANELKTIFQRKRVKGRAQRKLRKRLAASNRKITAPERSEILAKINPAVKVESPLLSSPPPLLGHPSIQTSPSSSILPMTSKADVLKNLPPFSGLTSTFDASLSDPVHVPRPDHSSLKQSTHERSFPLHSHSLISDRPVPLLDSDDLTSRGNPFKDTITPPMPLRRVTPEEIGARQDPLQLPGYITSSTHTSSLIPNLMALSSSAASNTSFTHPSAKSRPLLPTPMSAPLPALRRGRVGEPSRQLKITSFLSPPKKNRLDDPTMLEAEFNALPSVSRVGQSTRPPPLLPPERPGYSGESFLPPMAQRDRYFPTSKLRDGDSVPLSGLSDQDSVFDRLESTKYHQSHLQFSADQSQRTLELAPPLHDIHDDPFSRLGPSVTSLNALSMSQFGDSYATGSSARILLSSDVDERRPHPHTDRPHSRMDSVISRQTSDVVVKLEPDMEYEEDPSFSSRLYQTRPDGLNVAKVLDRFAPKRYQIAGVTPRPQRSTGYALVKQEREVVSVDSQEVSGGGERLVASSSGERFVDMHDSVRNVQQISGPSRGSERTVTEMGVSLTDDSTGQEVATGFQIGADELDYSRHVQSTGIHIPLSRKGLKVVAIDCEMVGCIRRIPHEQLLAIHMKGATAKSGAVVTTKATQGKKGGGGGGGLGGVLQKTQMKPQVWTRKERRKLQKGLNKLKEISVAARCSIIAYDTSVLYDKYINPTIGTDFTIKSYRTPWSGIRPYHMTGATPFHVARKEILDILCGCIVVGHNIGSDMQSLEIQDIPAAQIRDTSLHPILAKSAGGRALKKMAQSLLGRNIQAKSRVGHCSVEDATATMDLYKLVELEWED